jgi:hypothetical protein
LNVKPNKPTNNKNKNIKMREVFQKKLKKNYLIMYLHMEGGAEKIHFFLGGRYFFY